MVKNDKNAVGSGKEDMTKILARLFALFIAIGDLVINGKRYAKDVADYLQKIVDGLFTIKFREYADFGIFKIPAGGNSKAYLKEYLEQCYPSEMEEKHLHGLLSVCLCDQSNQFQPGDSVRVRMYGARDIYNSGVMEPVIVASLEDRLNFLSRFHGNVFLGAWGFPLILESGIYSRTSNWRGNGNFTFPDKRKRLPKNGTGIQQELILSVNSHSRWELGLYEVDVNQCCFFFGFTLVPPEETADPKTSANPAK